jgi:TP901 family phage tail tape measure protein
MTIVPPDVSETKSRIAGMFNLLQERAEEGDGLLSDLAEGIIQVGRSAKTWIAGAAVAAMTALTAALRKATAEAIQFEQAMVGVRKTADLTEGEMSRLSEKLLRVQSELGVSNTKLARIAETAGQLGIEGTDNIATFTETVALVGETTRLAADEAASQLARIAKAFDVPISKTENLASALNVLSNTTTAQVGDLADILNRVGKSAQDVNATATEVAGLGATLVDAGIEARRAGTGLRNVFLRVIQRAEKVAEVMGTTKEQIVAAFEKEGIGALKRFLRVLGQMDTAARSSAIDEIFGQENALQVKTLATALADAESNVTRANKGFEEGSSIQAEFANSLKSVSAEWGRLLEKLNAAWTWIGQRVTPAIESMLATINDWLGGLEEMRRDAASTTETLSGLKEELSGISETQALFDRYQRFVEEGKTETEGFDRVVEKLSDRLPDYATKVNEAGEAVGFYATAVEKLLAAQRRQVRAQAQQKIQAQIETFRTALSNLRQAQQKSLSAQQKLSRLTGKEAETIQELLQGGVSEDNPILSPYTDAVERLKNSQSTIRKSKETIDEVARSLRVWFDITEKAPGTDAFQKDLQMLQQELGVTEKNARKLIFEVQSLSESLSGKMREGASEEGGSGGASLLQRLSSIENVDKLDPATQKAIGDWVEALQSKLKGEIKAMQEAAGAQDVGLFGVDVEEMVSRIEEQRKRLEQGKINPAQFAEEASAIAKEYRTEIEKIIDRTVQLTTLSEEAGRRMKQGLKPARDEAQALRSEYIQRVGDLQARGEVSTETAEEIAKAIESMSDEALKAAGSFDEVLKRLSETDEISEDTFSAAQDALEHLTGETEEWGKAMQDATRFVRGIGDLADQFGDLSDEAEAAIDSTATLLDNVGRLVELSRDAEGGFSGIFSSLSGAVSGTTAILGAAGGLASLLRGDLASGPGTSSGLTKERLSELRNQVKENVRALNRNTDALLGQGVVGQSVSENTLHEVQDIVDQLASSIEGGLDQPQPVGGYETSLSEEQILNLLTQLEETGIKPFEDIASQFEDLRESGTSVGDALENLLDGFTRGGDRFEGLINLVDEITSEFGQFGESLSGLIRELETRRDALGQSAEELRSVLTDRLGDVGLDEELTSALTSRISELDLSEEGAVDDLITKLTEAFVGDRNLSFLGFGEDVELTDLLGDVTPDEFEEFISVLEESLTAGEGSTEGDFTTQAAKARIITEHQANEVVSFLQELVQLSRTQRDLLSNILTSMGGELPESAPDPETASAPGLGMSASLRETIAAAEADGFRPPDVGRQKQLSKKVVNQGQTNYIEFNIKGEMSAERTARKIKEYMRMHSIGPY